MFATLVSRNEELKLRGIIYFNWRDTTPYSAAVGDFWGLHTGPLGVDGSPKPGFAAFANTARRLTGG